MSVGFVLISNQAAVSWHSFDFEKGVPRRFSFKKFQKWPSQLKKSKNDLSLCHVKQQGYLISINLQVQINIRNIREIYYQIFFSKTENLKA